MSQVKWMVGTFVLNTQGKASTSNTPCPSVGYSKCTSSSNTQLQDLGYLKCKRLYLHIAKILGADT